MWKNVSFKDYKLRDKVCISMVMGCIALCGVIAADRYVKNDMIGTRAGTIGVGVDTLLAARWTYKARKNARRRMYHKKERD